MMKYPWIIAGICLVYSIFLFIPLPKSSAYPFPGVPELTRFILFFPILALVIWVLIAGLIKIFRKRELGKWIACILMCTPFLCFSISEWVSISIQAKEPERISSWQTLGPFLRDCLVDYHERAPERFHYTAGDEEVKVEGFTEYVMTKKSGQGSEIWNVVKIQDGKLIDPWGTPIRFGLDRDCDGNIILAGKRFLTTHETPLPKFKTAVVIASGQSPSAIRSIEPYIGTK